MLVVPRCWAVSSSELPSKIRAKCVKRLLRYGRIFRFWLGLPYRDERDKLLVRPHEVSVY